MKEKRTQHYDSHTVGAGKEHMDIILKYLIDEYKGQQRVKPDEWVLVTSTKSVPQQKIHLTVVHLFACLATSYHKTLLYYSIKPIPQVFENK
jgi:hypothetical protein